MLYEVDTQSCNRQYMTKRRLNQVIEYAKVIIAGQAECCRASGCEEQ